MKHPIAHYRAEKRLTLEAFGALVGATKGMVSKWEAGKALPRPLYMSRIVDVTGGAVSVDRLLHSFVGSQAVHPEAAE